MTSADAPATSRSPENGSGGYLWGVELAASLPFDMFADALDGFGAILSYSYTDSDIEIPGSISSVPNDHIPLPGLSQDVWNATLYYEKYGFGARIATRYRSEYIGEVTNFANERGLRYVDADMITDAQVSYTFGSGGMLERPAAPVPGQQPDERAVHRVLGEQVAAAGLPGVRHAVPGRGELPLLRRRTDQEAERDSESRAPGALGVLGAVEAA